MAGRIPQEFLDQLLSRVDLTEVIDARVPLRKAGRDFVACCPFHNEKTPSFTVSPHKQFFHCFGCGAHGNAISFLMEYERLEFPEAVEELAHAIGLELPRGAASRDLDTHGNLLEILALAEGFFRHQLHADTTHRKAVDYLRSRGLNEATIETFGIGYAPPAWDGLLKMLLAKGYTKQALITAGLAIEKDTGRCYDRFRDRIMFPIRNRRGHPIAFGGRALDDATPKYLNSSESPVFRKGQELYGLYEARTQNRQAQKRLLVVEGYMDVVALAQFGIRNAVATLGTSTTKEHLESLLRVAQDLIFCFDGDRAGRQAAWRALENALALLKAGKQIAFLFLPEGEDPDSVIRKEGKAAFEERLSHAMPLSDYFFHQLTTDADTTSLDGRARLAERASPLVHQLPDGVYRDMIIGRLAKLTGIDSVRLEKRLGITPEKSLPELTRPDHSLTRTPVRRAIALLLHRPELALKAGEVSRFAQITMPGLPLLLELIELWQNKPHISMGVVLERYRGTETGRILQRLAQWQPEISEDLLDAEFQGALEQLEKRHSVKKQLLNKLAQGKLSAEELELLRTIGGKASKEP